MVLIKNKPTPQKKATCLLTEVQYTRFLFKHAISSSHLSLHIRSGCSLETKDREIRQLLRCVTKETSLSRSFCRRTVFVGCVSRASLPPALLAGDAKCVFYWTTLALPAPITKPLSCFFARGKGFVFLMLCHFLIREMGPGSVEGGIYQTAAALEPGLPPAPSLGCASGPVWPSWASHPRLAPNPFVFNQAASAQLGVAVHLSSLSHKNYG